MIFYSTKRVLRCSLQPLIPDSLLFSRVLTILHKINGNMHIFLTFSVSKLVKISFKMSISAQKSTIIYHFNLKKSLKPGFLLNRVSLKSGFDSILHPSNFKRLRCIKFAIRNQGNRLIFSKCHLL